MKVQIRNGVAIIEGYVNAVERFSKVLYDTRGKFIERIMPKVFEKALEKNSDVLALLNHDYDRVLARTSDGSAKLTEDNIGLRAKIEVNDKTLIEKAKQGKLRGWSFGFKANKEERSVNSEGLEERTIRDIDLIEVSVLDDKKSPAYYGTSIELRDDETFVIEYRYSDDEKTEIVEEEEKKITPEQKLQKDIYKYTLRLNKLKLQSLKQL